KLGSSMQCEEGTEWLLELLMEVQLQQYFLRIRDELNVTRLSHFDYVKNEDLEKIGMGRPGLRRLWEAVKRRKTMCKRKSWMSKGDLASATPDPVLSPQSPCFAECMPKPTVDGEPEPATTNEPSSHGATVLRIRRGARAAVDVSQAVIRQPLCSPSAHHLCGVSSTGLPGRSIPWLCLQPLGSRHHLGLLTHRLDPGS
ncbi:hypothetical protein cypCar_00010928, partial [Cyprinus carpio]